MKEWRRTDCIRLKLFTVLAGIMSCVSAQGEINLPGRWTVFAVDGLHHIYGWDADQGALYKLWAPRYDSLTRIGGAPGAEGFLGVSTIAPLGNQQVYVLDTDGQKIALLGTNLQILQRLTYAQLPQEVGEGYPVLLTVGGGGELYLLLRETQEIVKIDAFGRVLLRFGGKLYGPGSIMGAAHIHADGERVFVADTIQRLLLEYDAWGNFLTAAPFPENAELATASREGKAFWGKTHLHWQGKTETTYTLPEPIKAVWLRGQRLYWLGERRVGWFHLP